MFVCIITIYMMNAKLLMKIEKKKEFTLNSREQTEETDNANELCAQNVTSCVSVAITGTTI